MPKGQLFGNIVTHFQSANTANQRTDGLRLNTHGLIFTQIGLKVGTTPSTCQAHNTHHTYKTKNKQTN